MPTPANSLPDGPKARLLVVRGQSKGAELLMGQRPRYMVGRSRHNDLQVKDSVVSRKHCQVEFDGNYFWLVDPGSANGTFVNGQRVRRYMLYDGDVVRIGKSVLVFSLVEPR